MHVHAIASKVMLKILQDIFRKGRETKDQIVNILWTMEKGKEFQKKHLLLFDYDKAFDCVDHNKLWNILKETGILDLTLPAS